jgi:hypothetical protein
VDRHHIEGEKQNGGMKEKMKNSFFNLCFHFYARLALAFGFHPESRSLTVGKHEKVEWMQRRRIVWIFFIHLRTKFHRSIK